MTTLVVDANIMLSAILGRSLTRLLRLVDAGIGLAAPVQQLAEVRTVLSRRKRLLDADITGKLDLLVAAIEPLPIDLFAGNEDRARARLDESGQPDWPVLAAAMTIDAAIWSLDRDFFGVGIPVWSTVNLDFAVAEGSIHA